MNRAAAHRGEQRRGAEPRQVGGAGDPQREEGRPGRAEEGRDAGGGGDRPDRLPGRDPRGCGDSAGAAAEQRVPDRQRGVGPGRDDHEHGDADECRHMRHFAA